jgi:ferric-dicitrate binding protein FerR (iron transport regulator)
MGGYRAPLLSLLSSTPKGSATADHQTVVHGQRTVTLKDGSTIQLNTNTAVNAFLDDKRDIHFLEREARIYSTE